MSEFFIPLYPIVSKLTFGGLNDAANINQMIFEKAKRDFQQGVNVCKNDSDDFCWPRAVCYETLCSMLATTLRDSIRLECVANAIPVPRPNVSGALSVALSIYNSSPHNVVFQWFERAVNVDDDEEMFRRAASAGYLVCMFAFDATDRWNDKLWEQFESSKNLDHTNLVFSALQFYRSALSKNQDVDPKLVKFAQQSLEVCLLSICYLIRRNMVFLSCGKTTLYQLTNYLSNYYYDASLMLMALVQIENYQFCRSHEQETVAIVTNAANRYNQQHWIESVKDKCAANLNARLCYL